MTSPNSTLHNPSAPEAPRPEPELIKRTLAGDDKAFQTLMTQYLPLVYNLLYKMLNSRELAEEVTQETFVKVYNNLHKFDQKRAFKPWMLRIASNAAISELRKASKIVSLDALNDDGQWKESDHATSEDASTVVERKLASEEVIEAINHLDPKYRQVLLLRYCEDLSYEEISEVTDTPLNTIRTWIRRGREQLVNALPKNFRKEPSS